MCGIIGMISAEPVSARLIEGLKRLEYRGYDSAGIATLEAGRIQRRRAPGKIAALEKLHKRKPLAGQTGIGHTRWATHGGPTKANAHPHATKNVAIVHNGIIENHRALREELAACGAHFESETDSEVIAHLITAELEADPVPARAFAAAIARLEGAFAIVAMIAEAPGLLLVARQGSPLAIALKGDEAFVGSDAIALEGLADQIIYLEDGDVGLVEPGHAQILDRDGALVSRSEQPLFCQGSVSKAGHAHYMLKEILEQPATTERTIAQYIDDKGNKIQMPDLDGVDIGADRAIIIGCGTAHYAGRIGEYWLEGIAGIAVETDIASEFHYRKAPNPTGGFGIFVSQSGETADTLAALKHAQGQGLKSLAIVNVPESTIWRTADARLPTQAGPEIGVASTKAFTAQLCALACLTVAAARKRKRLSSQEETRLVTALKEMPARLSEAISASSDLDAIAEDLATTRSVLFLGRGPYYPLALEAALKFKEITYIHAEAYAAGELKHGPIALIDKDMRIVVIAPHDQLFEKTLSNMQEVAARGGRIILISDAAGCAAAKDVAHHSIALPACDPFTAPIVYAAPAQMLAYLTACSLGVDVDQPRNLAKSVTVE